MNAIELISQDLFDKVRSRFSNLQMGDESGAVTVDPTEARFFDFDFVVEGNNLGRISVSINDLGNLKLFYSQGIVEERDPVTQQFWFDFLKEMRQFAMRRLLRFDPRDITKGNLEKNDFQYLAQNGSKEDNMTESTMYGSSKSSYRPLDKTLLIIRHNNKVGEDRGARSRSNNINAIFIQNEAGERFKYPMVHMAGAKAMQRHVSNGGATYDDAGQSIIKMSEQIRALSTFKRQIGNSEQLTQEALGIVDRASGKLSELRSTIENLSKQTYYAEWRESLANLDLAEQTELYNETVKAGRPGIGPTGMLVGEPGKNNSHTNGTAVDIQEGKSDPRAMGALESVGLFKRYGEKDPVHFEVSGNLEGIASGPESGYNALLHGNELIKRLTPNSVLDVMSKTPAQSSITTTSSMKPDNSILMDLVQNLYQKMDDVVSELSDLNDTQSEIKKYSRA
jgi:hypothetical protein